MHIRFFNTYEPVNSFYRDLLPALAEQGHQIEVLVSRTEYRPGRTPLESSLEHPNINIRRAGVGRFAGRSRWQKALVRLSYMGAVAAKTLFGSGVDLNFFLTQPPLFGLWGALLKRLRDQPYTVLVMDLYPDVAVQNGLLSPNGGAARLLTRLSRLALRQANRVVVIGRCMAGRLIQSDIAAEQVVVIPNWANLEEVYPIPPDQNHLRQDLGLADKFVVLYSGNLGVSHFFDDLLTVARRLQDRPEIQFVFIGEGSRRREVEAAQARDRLSNVTLLPFQPAAQLPHSLSLGDVHFVSLRPGFEGLVVPSKTYGVLAAGRPVIFQGDRQSEIACMLQEEAVGSVVDCHDPDGLIQAILAYYYKPELCLQQGHKARTVATRTYSRQQGIAQYSQFLHNLTSKPLSPEKIPEQL